MAKCWMLCGVPGSGKSTWVSNQKFDPSTTVIISTDNILERKAAAVGKTYTDVFKKEYKSATVEMNKNLRDAIAARKDIVWDQTNLTVKTRAGKLAQFPQDYEMIGVYFTTPDNDELLTRLKSRPGKFIPFNLVMGMASQLVKPTLDEGFVQIITA